ncbi:hydroxyacid dehydrogenase [Candidatus Pelagibacter bacterium]|jgi:D-3-phosphoglycerate dehydrogenase / 2-oxoglutarate reductase|nr:hydroxyacid dehydrogenase [Candidatus Pelagibacter bacterium]
MKKIAIIEQIHKDGLDILEKNPGFHYELITDVSEENLIEKLPEFDGCTLRVSKLNKNILKNCPKLKVISRHGVGYDNVDLNYIKKNNITLLITATANAVAVAEHVIYMMLSISKSINRYDQEVRSGYFKKNASTIETLELFKKEILIVGFGRIGKSLIKRCLGFEMKVNIFDPFVSKEIISQFGGNKIDNFDEGLKKCDYLSLHIPLTEKTKNMINISKLKIMKKNTIIINTSRGGIINELDLNKALNENIIFGAGLDVFEKEPINIDNPILKNKKVLLSPHSATFTNECKSRMSIETTKNIIDFFENKLDKSMIVKL